MGITSRIINIERSAGVAWPALREEVLDGWRLRFADGFTRRSNSVQPFLLECRGGKAEPDGDPSGHRPLGEEVISERVAACEAAYHAVGQPAIFRIPPLADPRGLTDALSAKGYRREGETVVMTREIPSAQMVADGERAAYEDPLSEAAWPALIRLSGTPERHQETYASLLRQASPPLTAAHTAALLSQGQEIVCRGRGVVAGGRLGVFDVATGPGHRRRGLAARLVKCLVDWGRGQGASEAYLQVEVENAGAVSLYGRLGFTELYRYVYWARRM